MPLYEHVYIARQDISPAQMETLTEELSAIVKNNGGKIAKTEYWGLRTLQYKIRKNRKGHYGLLNICLLYTSPSPRDRQKSRMPSSA